MLYKSVVVDIVVVGVSAMECISYDLDLNLAWCIHEP